MIWTTWRQFRPQAVAGLAVLAAAAIYFVATGLSIHHTFTVDQSSCGATNDCDDVMSTFRSVYAPMFDLSQVLMIFALGLMGTFWGAPLVAREVETGTHQFAWNQSVTRTRWLATKLLVLGLASMACAALLGALMTWWAGPLDPIAGSRFADNVFVTHDVVPIGYGAFAFAFGSTAGLLLRRTVPAMAATLVVFLAVQIIMPTLVRPHLLPSTTVNFAVNASIEGQVHGVEISGTDVSVRLDGPSAPPGAWILRTTPIENAAGQAIRASDYPSCFPDFNLPDGQRAQIRPPGGPVACLAADDLHETITYQPASHYWPLQWAETGILLAISALLTGFCFWWIRRLS